MVLRGRRPDNTKPALQCEPLLCVVKKVSDLGESHLSLPPATSFFSQTEMIQRRQEES